MANVSQNWAVESADGTCMGEGMTEERAQRSAEENRAKGIECYVVDYSDTDEDE